MSSLDELRKKSSIITSQNNNSLSSLSRKEKSLDDRINFLAKKNIKNASIELKKNTAEIIFIIDKSGSCQGLEHSTIKGINDLIKNERKNCYPTKMTLILFDSICETVYDRQDIRKTYDFTYSASGGTALYDAIVKNLYSIKDRQLKIGDVDPNKTIVAIMTDGDDNESRYLQSDARKCISDCKKIGWKFIFLGSYSNAKMVASSLGIDDDMTENYVNNTSGILSNFSSINRALMDVRETGKVSKNWSDTIKNNNRETNYKYLEVNKKKVLRLGGK